MAIYTVQDYVIYITILFVVLWIFSRFVFTRIDFDKYFLMATVPYLIFGITFRMLADVGVYEKTKYLTVTPGVQLLAVAIGLSGIFVGLFLQKHTKIQYWQTLMAFGIIASLFSLSKLIPAINFPMRIFPPILMAAGITGALYFLSGFHEKAGIFKMPSNVAIIFAHLFDGSATFIGIDYYGFYEEHLLPDILINAAGTAFVMIPLKIVVVFLALYYVEKWYNEEIELGKEDPKKIAQQYHILKFVFFYLGFGPGMRDSILPAVLLK